MPPNRPVRPSTWHTRLRTIPISTLTRSRSTVVLEQGPYRTKSDFTHDALSIFEFEEFQDGGNQNNQQTFRREDEMSLR